MTFVFYFCKRVQVFIICDTKTGKLNLEGKEWYFHVHIAAYYFPYLYVLFFKNQKVSMKFNTILIAYGLLIFTV